MNNLIIVSIILINFNSRDLFGQDNLSFIKTDEKITKLSITQNFSDRYLFYSLGKSDNEPIYLYEDLNTHKITLYRLSERTQTIKLLLPKYEEILTRYHSNFKILDSLLFLSKFSSESPSDYGYYELLVTDHINLYFLDSIYNADKKIHSSFSSDGKYLLVNTLNTLSDYYNPEQDDRIMVYDLSDIDKGNIKKEYIPCDKCADSYLVNNTLFFTIGRKDAYGGFNNKDIYMAPWGNLKDTVKIASNTKIISISPDGKYILGSRFFDRQKNTCVIIDVASKKYQMLLGRDYYQYQSFYSYYENKFAFDFKAYLIYVDFPESYPFDALNWRNEEIPDWTEKEFWSQYQHDPLPNRN